MRPKSAHAALSGVGEHPARESESAKWSAAGKERVANAHPHFEPGTARSRVLCFNISMSSDDSKYGFVYTNHTSQINDLAYSGKQM